MGIYAQPKKSFGLQFNTVPLWLLVLNCNIYIAGSGSRTLLESCPNHMRPCITTCGSTKDDKASLPEKIKGTVSVSCGRTCTGFFGSRLILSFNRFRDVLGIQLACLDCIFRSASWIIFQSCLNLVQLYHITFQTSGEKKLAGIGCLTKKISQNLTTLYLNIA